jgi:endonuclease/exonuclease/phosphatase family metal-dependent hydrolase
MPAACLPSWSALLAGALLCAPALAQDMPSWMTDAEDLPPDLPASFPDVPAVDGDVSDWPQRAYGLGDERVIALRFRLHNPTTLTSSPGPVIVRIDADDNRLSGRRSGRIGAELEITFSDQSTDEGRPRWGPSVRAFRPDGSQVFLNPYDIGLEVAPTHASEWFEMRINRRGPLDEFLPQPGIGANGRLYVSIEAAGRQPAEPNYRFMWMLVPPNPPAPAPLEAELPTKPGNALRVLSWNVLWSTPQRDPAPFARVLEALKPDIILFQEWDRAETGEAEMVAWLNEHAGWAASAGGAWSAERSDAWGVAVASHYPITARGPDELLAPGTRWSFPSRYAAAVVETPLGSVAAASIHYKCCAGVGSEEDERRLVEAQAVNADMHRFVEASGADFAIVGGDFNLNGTPAVLSITGAGLDTDGSPLEVAEAYVLGDSVMSTFGRPDRGSSGSRLDFISYPDASFEVVSAFVIDSARLSDATLERSGLRRLDSEASDHRPVVVDLIPISGR